MKTRAQIDMEKAHRLVTEVSGRGAEVKKIYGGVCHSFPVMVRTCGLCQAIAFSQDKATSEGDRGQAHSLLLKHVAALIGLQPDSLLQNILNANAKEYMFYTRRILSAWIYFKRFAVSILDVDSGQGES
ncbi:MAG: type III-B CRISPR module-associated protein Cmr5 [Fimbriimonadia bacterium]|nr:type III-B CRISPR module-associated protein Cmr5 [Fimbriimonadia bacterium]